MTRLRSIARDCEWLVPACCLLGRSGRCDIVLEDPVISAEHAMLRWRNGTWELQDLHSRNGTYIAGKLLKAGDKLGLHGPFEFGLGQREANFWIDGGPPLPHAVKVERGREVVEGRGGFLALPNTGDPEVTVLHRESGWMLERRDSIESVADGTVLRVSDGSWRLYLPPSLPPTEDAEDARMTLANLTLAFVVGGRGELRGLELICGQRRIALQLRAHLRVLLALAQIRQRQVRDLSAPPGWIAQDALVRQLGYDKNRLRVEVHRTRRQFTELGVVDAANVIERHEREPKLRIGVGTVEIVNG